MCLRIQLARIAGFFLAACTAIFPPTAGAAGDAAGIATLRVTTVVRVNIDYRREYTEVLSGQRHKDSARDALELKVSGTTRWELNRDSGSKELSRDFTVTVAGEGRSREDPFSSSWTWHLEDARARGYEQGAAVNPKLGYYRVYVRGMGKLLDVLVARGATTSPEVSYDEPRSPVYATNGALMMLVDLETDRAFDKLDGNVKPNSPQFTVSGSKVLPYTSTYGDLENDGITKIDGSVAVTYTLDFGGDKEQVEAVIVPGGGYMNWKPEVCPPKPDELCLLAVEARLLRRGKSEPASRTGKFIFELAGVSREKGKCLNWPPASASGKPEPDLRLEKKDNPGLAIKGEEGQRAESEKGLDGAAVVIRSLDWGAWGGLRVSVVMDDDGATVQAHLEKDRTKDELSIPRDDNNNHVQDTWELDIPDDASRAADADEDDSPAGAFPGDGFSLYEEYRGFMVRGEHWRLNPTRKDLFVKDLTGEAERGISYFGQISGIEVHRIESGSEMDPRRVVNFNRGGNDVSAVEQHGLVIEEGRLCTEDELRRKATRDCLEPNVGGQSPMGPPKYVDKIELLSWLAGNADTVAHELGHAVGIIHHGEGDYWCDDTDTTFNGDKPIPLKKALCRSDHGIDAYAKRGGRRVENISIAVQHGERSGNQSCIMRYPEADFIEIEDGTFVEGYPWEPRISLCDTRQGAKVGDAMPGGGICREQICLPDYEERRRWPW